MLSMICTFFYVVCSPHVGPRTPAPRPFLVARVERMMCETLNLKVVVSYFQSNLRGGASEGTGADNFMTTINTFAHPGDVDVVPFVSA